MDIQGLLKQYFGYDAFRPGQRELIDRILQRRDALCIMPTGAGKSVCYQLPALAFPGVTLVISPLISLMKDQVGALKQAGIPAAYINSSLTPAQCALALKNAAKGMYRLIYVAPERLHTKEFLDYAMRADVSMLTVDEAHCISRWGHDFRPSYLRIAEFVQLLPNRPVLSAFTATATGPVKTDIAEKLQLRDPYTIATGFDRPNLKFIVQKPWDTFDALLHYLRRNAGRAGIVYCSTRKTVEEVCDRLSILDFSVTRYHAGLGDDERRANQDDFLYDRKRIMIATNAFGMGIDKSNVAFVLHYNMPMNMDSYYQEAGRAGRDGSPAECVLFYSARDVVTNRWLIEHSTPAEGTDEATAAAVTAHNLELLKKMTYYCHTKDCLRRTILRYFGERPKNRCGNCSNCGASVRDAVKSAPGPAAAAEPEPSEKFQRGLYVRLKCLRMELARQQSVPAYVIFTDATLTGMCRLLPASEAELLRVPGVGEEKSRRYGKRFLYEIANYLSENPD